MFFFFNDTATTEIYTLSLHDALPISRRRRSRTPEPGRCGRHPADGGGASASPPGLAARRKDAGCHRPARSEEHTSELQSQSNLVCRLLLEKKTYFHGYSISPLEAD